MSEESVPKFFKEKLFHLIITLTVVLTKPLFGQMNFQTLPADSVTQTSAILHGWFIPDTTATGFGFGVGRLGYDVFYFFNVKYYSMDTIRSGDTVFVSYRVEGLMPNTIWHYYFKVYDHTGFPPDSLHESFTTLIDSNAGGFVIPITITDAAGYTTPQRFFGIHTHATYCYDWAVGEREEPPPPPFPAVNFRFNDIYGEAGSCMGQGLRVDLRKYNNAFQTDTFRIQFRPEDNRYPIIFNWSNLTNNFSGSIRLQDPFSGSFINTDMKTQTSDTIYYPWTDLYIIAEGPTNLLSAWFTDLRDNQVVVGGRSNPGGAATDAWFEWGLTDASENRTPRQSIGSSAEHVEFTAQISGLAPNTLYHYRVVTENTNGISYGVDQTVETASVISAVDPTSIPRITTLFQNFPNPFNPQTTIEYFLQDTRHVRLIIYDILGQSVATVIDGIQEGGYKTVNVDASKLSSGLYFYRLTTGSFFEMKKMLLVK